MVSRWLRCCGEEQDLTQRTQSRNAKGTEKRRAEAALPRVVVAAEGAAELDGGETELVAEAVGCFGELFQFFATVGFEEVELLRAVGEGGEGYAEEADFAPGVAMLPEEVEKDGEDVGVEFRGFREGFRASVGFESGVADGQRQGARGEDCFSEAPAGFMGKAAEK